MQKKRKKRVVTYRPTVKQMRFLRSRKRHLCYGGARGGGKSWIVRLSAKTKALEYPGIKQLIVRETYQELLNNHIMPLRDMLYGIATYNESKKLFAFRNGSIIKLGYCAADKDLNQFQGSEYDIIYLEESTNLREEWIAKINACVRGTNSFPKMTIYTCNPGGVSHGYHKRLFVDRKYLPGENPDDYEFIQASVHDNSALMTAMPAYVKQLEALPPKLRKMWLDGSWDVAEGMYFESFRDNPDGYQDRRWTHVIPAKGFRVPKSWPVYRAFDWGFRRPYACNYYTMYDGVMYMIAEAYGVQRDIHGTVLPNEGVRLPPDQVFADIRRLENEHPLLAGREITGVADPAIWDAEMGFSVAEAALRQGIYFTKGDHKRIQGWLQCQQRLRFSDEGYPMFYVLDSCTEFIRTIPLLQYDPNKPEDLWTDGEDHSADAWRYFCQSRPLSPTIEEPTYSPAFGSDPLSQFTKR